MSNEIEKDDIEYVSDGDLIRKKWKELNNEATDIKKEKAPLEIEIRKLCDEMAEFLISKNKSYGNSAAEPIDIFSKGLTPLQKIDVRIDDKLSRLQKGNEYAGDDTVKDLAGYLLLRMIVANNNKD